MSAADGRRRHAPEVLQTSAMDCGPATLKALLGGFGIAVDYTRIRELCQTEVDGTSIDTLERVARAFGLDARQVLVPLDHLDDPRAQLPAIVVTRLPGGEHHFVLAWRTSWNGAVEVMDPDGGRRRVPRRAFRRLVSVHHAPMPTATWRAWAARPVFTDRLAERLARLGATPAAARERVAAALAAGGWRPLAALDASVRLVQALQRSGGVRAGEAALRLVDTFAAQASSAAGATTIPAEYWDVRPAAPGDEPATVVVRGAVMVRVAGRLAGEVEAAGPVPPAADAPRLRPALPAALQAVGEPAPSRDTIVAHWRRAVLEDGKGSVALLATALLVAAIAVMVQALLLRGLVDVAGSLALPEQRFAALLATGAFLVAAAAIEIPLALGLLRLGRRVEARLRIALQSKLARVTDAALQGRPTSDLAERAHALAMLRGGVTLAGRGLRSLSQLLLTAGGLLWLDPACWLPLLATTVAAVLLPWTSQRLLRERELRTRVVRGTLARFYLDALCGLLPSRTHGAGPALRRAHESLLVGWVRSGRALLSGTILAGALQGAVGLALVVWLLGGHLAREGEGGGILLFAWWAMGLLSLGEDLAQTAAQLPGLRNASLRVLETLTAQEEPTATSPIAVAAATAPDPDAAELATRIHLRAAGSVAALPTLAPHADASGAASTERGVALRWAGFGVVLGGHPVLTDVALDIAAGEHVAIVGRSGAGKSTLVGTLLGWHRGSGELLVDGRALTGAHLAALRAVTAWVDPSVRLWNQSLLANVQYGNRAALGDVGVALRAADLLDLIERLPDGLQSRLGEAGGSLSGGEGQRVRHARALLRQGVRLVLLDEPFRGLDHGQRAAFLARARAHWRHATLLCVTHDLAETRSFDRVLVVEGGRVAEDGAPAALCARPGSRYAALLAEDQRVRDEVWGDPTWRRLHVRDGHVGEEAAE